MNYIHKTFAELIAEYQNDSIAFDLVFHLSESVNNMDTYCLHRNNIIDFDEFKFRDIFFKVKHTQTPLERYTKTVFFDNQKFCVFDDVFIPRWETEGILNIAESILQKSEEKSFSYIDVCSGTGVIGITLLKKYSDIFSQKKCLLDISPKSIHNIKENLKKHKINCDLICGDWFENIFLEKYQFITANFPYIDINESYDINILYNEPKTALFASDHGWEHYKNLILFMEENKFWKIILCECSEFHKHKWQDLKNIYDNDTSNTNIEITLHNDFNNKFRFVCIKRLQTQ